MILKLPAPSHTEAPAFAYYPRLRKVADYVRHHLAERISLRTAAAVAGMEAKSFSSFFHLKTGVCFSNWLLRLRILRAMEMISSCDDSITAVAGAVGFNDARTFQRGFKRHTAMTPRAFKKSVVPLIAVTVA